ncbi:unnamed protein product [Didymodactylos carnosus]|uniref:Uncharacterized protein n=1 Tax=Didymodactylos carnosus TaxID=1234261 RepID=A0A814TCE2_9BILA|nr:unnamed protein product [Didymodactylos carnosus]CAF3923319.1 unnamed protein product [Didymodactylos carnosus]
MLHGGIDATYRLKFFRCLSISLWISACAIDMLAHSTTCRSTSFLRFLFGATCSVYEIAGIIYASGAVAFGVSIIEIYIVIPLSIANCVLSSAHNRVNDNFPSASILLTIRICCLLIATELCNRNFKRFYNYQKTFNKAANSLLRQSLFFIIALLFFTAPGLRTVYRDIDQGRFFSANDDETNLMENTLGREQLRILRDFLLINIVCYAVFNKHALDIKAGGRFYFIRLIIVGLFTVQGSSVLIANADPLKFRQLKIYFDIIECVTFVVTIKLLSYNLYFSSQKKFYHQMDPTPSILPC